MIVHVISLGIGNKYPVSNYSYTLATRIDKYTWDTLHTVARSSGQFISLAGEWSMSEKLRAGIALSLSLPQESRMNDEAMAETQIIPTFKVADNVKIWTGEPVVHLYSHKINPAYFALSLGVRYHL